MKRLLLSTALILGTLTGVMGATGTAPTPTQLVLGELDRPTPNYTLVQTNQAALRTTTTANDLLFFNTQSTINIFLSDIVKQATFSLPLFETAIVFMCILSHIYVHWISDDPTKIASNDRSRIAVPITSALTVKALDSVRKIWNDYQKSSNTILQGWKTNLQDATKRYNISYLLACAFLAKSHTSEGVIIAKLQEIFSTARNFSSIDRILP